MINCHLLVCLFVVVSRQLFLSAIDKFHFSVGFNLSQQAALPAEDHHHNHSKFSLLILYLKMLVSQEVIFLCY